MSVHSRPSMKYQVGMELRDRKMTKDCTQPLRIGNIRALNGCAGSSNLEILLNLSVKVLHCTPKQENGIQQKTFAETT